MGAAAAAAGIVVIRAAGFCNIAVQENVLPNRKSKTVLFNIFPGTVFPSFGIHIRAHDPNTDTGSCKTDER